MLNICFRTGLESDDDDEWDDWCTKKEAVLNHTVGVHDNTELIESRLMCIEEVKLLDYLEHYMGEISDMFCVYAVHILKTYIPPIKKPIPLCNPDAILEMQLQIHMYLRDIIVFCNNALRYAKNLEDNTIIEN